MLQPRIPAAILNRFKACNTFFFLSLAEPLPPSTRYFNSPQLLLASKYGSKRAHPITILGPCDFVNSKKKQRPALANRAPFFQ
jgi:hypothetical protein